MNLEICGSCMAQCSFITSDSSSTKKSRDVFRDLDLIIWRMILLLLFEDTLWGFLPLYGHVVVEKKTDILEKRSNRVENAST